MGLEDWPGSCFFVFRLCLLSFILYPGVTNTTVVHQETNVNYGPFKTTFQIVLDYIVQERIKMDLKTATNLLLVGLVVFVGIYDET